MFADDLPGTLSGLREALRRGGRAAFAVWGPAARNPMFRLRAEVSRPFVKVPPPDPETTPHPLRLAPPQRILVLHRGDGMHCVGATDLLGRDIAQAEVTDLAGANAFRHGSHGLFDWRRGVGNLSVPLSAVGAASGTCGRD